MIVAVVKTWGPAEDTVALDQAWGLDRGMIVAVVETWAPAEDTVALDRVWDLDRGVIVAVVETLAPAGKAGLVEVSARGQAVPMRTKINHGGDCAHRDGSCVPVPVAKFGVAVQLSPVTVHRVPVILSVAKNLV